MKEVKFRAWDIENEEMIKNPSLYTDDWADDINGYFEYWTKVVEDDERLVFMQYTGLKDKNKKEIYEDDILDCGDFIGKVEFNLSFCAFVITDGYEIKTFLDVGNEVEIMGNVYENEDLIGKEIK